MTYLIAIFVYLLVLTGISIYKSRQVKTQADFALAGRSLSPWVMVCTMLAVWIGTGSIVGAAGQAYRDGLAAMILPAGTLIGMILLAMIAGKARRFEAYTVPEIIGTRFNRTARLLAVVALILAYMVIVSYQFNAGGMVLEVIVGKKEAVPIKADRVLTADQLKKGYVVFTPAESWKGLTTVGVNAKDGSGWSGAAETFTIEVCSAGDVAARVKAKGDAENHIVVKSGGMAKIRLSGAESYKVASMPEGGKLVLSEPKLTAKTATIMAAVFVIAYTMLAGLMSLALTDVVTGIIITVSMFVAFPVLLYQAGGFSGMETAFAEMGDRGRHMQFWGTYSYPTLINFLLPVFLLILGDANQYQRIFASKNAKGARTAVIMLIFIAMAIELLIITCAWVSSSMIPDPENGRHVLIYAARHFMPDVLGVVFMVTVVGIIISTADSFLLVPATTFIKDVYLNHINPKASEKRIVFISRMMVLAFGIIAWLISLAFAESTTVFQKALYAYTIYGAAITPCLVAALFWKRATSWGAVASIISGTAVTLIWGEVAAVKASLPAFLSELDAVLPAITVSVLALVVVSLMTPKQLEQKQKVVAEG
ncbi:MAG: sodium:solute symporter family protein [Phycisphaerae bacterium]|jgi:Na+/proline symporter|nr:sodium:solute symporter family protein [Phycisphaerae bacterium]